MKKALRNISVLLLVSMLSVIQLNAQGAFGGNMYFNFAWTAGQTGVAGASWTSPAMGVENSTITVTAPAANPVARSKQGYTQALKCTGVEISELSSLGYVGFAVQNGSSGAGTFATFTFQIWNGTGWVTTETFSVPANGDVTLIPTSVISRSATRVRYFSSNSSWFFGVKVYDHIDKANATAAPNLISVNPAEGSNLPSSGSITLQFDELVKAGTGTPTLGNATISSVQYMGNKVVVNYSGYTNATNPLSVPAASVTDFSDTALTTDITKNYAIDITAPLYVSTSIADGSNIHINDLGEDARKIKVTFDEDIAIGTGTITFNGATVSTSVSGKVLTISYAGLPYNSTNYLTVPATYITDLSGNTLQSSFMLTYFTGARDAVSPVLTSQSVANLATGQPIGGSLSFTFSEIVVPTSTPVTINGSPAYISNNGNVIGVNYTNMPYESNVVIDFPAGCLTDTCGNPFGGTVMSFDTKVQSNKAFDFIVAKDATGTHSTIQDAINAASGTARTFIYVKPGVYSEKLVVNKAYVSLIGCHPDSVIITWNECSSTSTILPGTGISSPGTDASFTMLIAANEFYGENFTVQNAYDYNNGTDLNKQAVALEHINSDKAVLKNVKMTSYQDTYYPKSQNGRVYLLNCFIQGGTDFIFGSGTAYMDTCTIKCVIGGQYITAASGSTKEFGLVLNKCNISKTDASINMGTDRLYYLGRPWQNPSKSSFVNCWFTSGMIQPAGWSEWSPTTNHLSAVYSEYNSRRTDGTLVDVASRVAWSKQLTANEASRYNPDNAFNYGSSNTWNPIPYVTAPDAPVISSVSVTGDVTWSPVNYAIGYLVFKNDSLIGSTTSTMYSASCIPTDSFSVVAYNEYGATSLRSTNVLVGIKEAKIKSGFLVATLVTDMLGLKNPNDFLSVEVISVEGAKVISTKECSSISISGLPTGYYLVKGLSKNGDVYIDKIIKK